MFMQSTTKLFLLGWFAQIKMRGKHALIVLLAPTRPVFLQACILAISYFCKSQRKSNKKCARCYVAALYIWIKPIVRNRVGNIEFTQTKNQSKHVSGLELNRTKG